jgi:hypothetical protein
VGHLDIHWFEKKKNPSQDRESKGQGTMRQNGTRGQQQQDTLAVATASAAICTVAESLPMPEIMVSDLPAASRCTYDDDSKQDPWNRAGPFKPSWASSKSSSPGYLGSFIFGFPPKVAMIIPSLLYLEPLDLRKQMFVQRAFLVSTHLI